MSTFDYSIFERAVVFPPDVPLINVDLLISAYNDSARVGDVFRTVTAKRKVWWLHEEYHVDVPATSVHDLVVRLAETDDVGLELISALDQTDLSGLGTDAQIAVDITGFMRPHLMILCLLLHRRGFESILYFYSDPFAYSGGSGTIFSKGAVREVLSIPGFEGIHGTRRNSQDLLVIGAGYDDKLVRAVAEFKRSARHSLLFGLPSLQPHMYQESQLRMASAEGSIQGFASRAIEIYAPAHNPFMTAEVLRTHVEELRVGDIDRNVFLAPTGPKTQALGFALFYLTGEMGGSTSMIFPRVPSYSAETASGFSRLHVFKVETALLSLF